MITGLNSQTKLDFELRRKSDTTKRKWKFDVFLEFGKFYDPNDMGKQNQNY